MTKTKYAPDEAISEIRRLLAEWLETSQEAHRPVARILKLLEGLETVLRGVKSSARRRGQAKLIYAVERMQHGDVLVERRAGSTAQAFKLPRAIYDAVAEVLAAQLHPQTFAVIAEGVASRVAAADFHIRLCLRFLTSRKIALVSRTRARYQAKRPATLVKDSARVWASLSARDK